MTAIGWTQILVYALTILALTKPLGAYMYAVFEGERRPVPRVLGPVERALYRLCGIDSSVEQTWGQYALAMLLFSVCSLVATYALLRLQHRLPLNPQGFGPVGRAIAFNTAASFASNTNWQAYAGEATLGYLAQMAGLAWQNFVSAAVGIGVALALMRGVTRHVEATAPHTIGNCWVDLVRALVYLLLPLSVLLAVVLVAGGVLQNLSPYVHVSTLEGVRQFLPMGPVASQEAIKLLGTNGGGFFNANSAHPFENPTPLTNWIETVAIFAIPSGLTYTFGRMARDQRQGWVLWAAMGVLFVVGVGVAYAAESGGNPAARGLQVEPSAGNMEGKEVRFGVAASALFATVTTDASCGAVNAMHDSFTPLGGLVPLVNMQLGEVIFGGVGSGLYGLLVFAILSVFIAGLMVGRTPEYLGKKIEAYEVQLATCYVLVFPVTVLVLAAWAAVAPPALAAVKNPGPHGLSEILYAFTSGAGNNGSAFAGLDASTRWWLITTAVAMLVGRYAMMLPVLAIGGALVGKRAVPAGPGTFPTNGPLFVALLVGVIVVVGALTFFPALVLGPVVEHFLAVHGRLF